MDTLRYGTQQTCTFHVAPFTFRGCVHDSEVEHESVSTGPEIYYLRQLQASSAGEAFRSALARYSVPCMQSIVTALASHTLCCCFLDRRTCG